MGEILVNLVNALFGLIVFLVIANAVMSWLVAFGVLNMRNQFVYQIARMLDGITDPLLRPFRAIMPNLGGIDITPILLLLLIQLLIQPLFNEYAAPILIEYLGARRYG